MPTQRRGVALRTEANLADRAVLAKDIVHLVARDLEREVAHVENAVDLRREARLEVPMSYVQARRQEATYVAASSLRCHRRHAAVLVFHAIWGPRTG